MTGPPRCAVVGDPVAHSLSPTLHAAAYVALGLDGTYDAHRVPAGGLTAFLAGLDEQWAGVSVTMPLKREALALADRLDDAALRAGGVNTLVPHRAPGAAGTATTWHGHNTDVPGAVAAMRERGVRPREVTVLGGGATAASVGLAAVDLGARRVRLLVRDPSRADEAVRALDAHPAAPAVEVRALEPAWVAGDLVVATVPADAQTPALVAAALDAVGRTSGAGGSGGSGAVFEALYDPWPTPLAAASAAAGVPLVGGLDLLVHQAALQLALFRGPAGPVEVMREAGLAALAARGPRP